MKPDIEKWIILPDLQVPFEDKQTLRAVEAYMADHRWDGYINLGDFLDFRELSSFDKENARLDKTASIARTYKAGNEILDRHVKLVRAKNRNAKMVLLEGNHEYRVERYLDEHPESEGLVEVPVGLRLKERNIKWVPFWSKGTLYNVGHAYFVHGKYISKYHAARMVEAYGKCIYYGHTHDMQTFPKVQLGDNKTFEGASLGCLCRYDQKYLKGAPTNWQQGFAVLYKRPNSFYNMYLVRIFNHRFISPDGKLYGGE